MRSATQGLLSRFTKSRIDTHWINQRLNLELTGAGQQSLAATGDGLGAAEQTRGCAVLHKHRILAKHCLSGYGWRGLAPALRGPLGDVVPTIFYGSSPARETKIQIRDWGEEAAAMTTCDAEFWALVDEADLNWVYLREGEGSLQPEGLVGCEGIKEAYVNKSVALYRLERH